MTGAHAEHPSSTVVWRAKISTVSTDQPAARTLQVPRSPSPPLGWEPDAAMGTGSQHRTKRLRTVGNDRTKDGPAPTDTCRQRPTGDTFWLIAAHGTQADFIRNIGHDPHVRVMVNRRWRSGVAVLMPEDDTRERSRTLPYRWDTAIGRTIATTPMTVRIDSTKPVTVGQAE